MMKVLIGIVDDHAITRRGIKTLLELTNKYKIIVEASSGKELFTMLETAQTLPEILILDLSMPDSDGFQMISQISSRYPTIKTLIFSLFQSEDVIINAIKKGAAGYVTKSSDPETLETAIQNIVRYGFHINEQIRKKITLEKTAKPVKGFHGKQVLTEKEIQFIRCASSNLTYKEIAAKMNVQPKTLENYRDSIFQKLGINNRAALTLYGIQNGIVQLF